MKILSIDTSSKSLSVAYMNDGTLVTSHFENNGFTHSTTLMPAIDAVLKQNDISPSEIDVFAVCKGPGSFTGLRIGISTVKGISLGTSKPCFGASTMHAMAVPFINQKLKGIICPCMDARRNQVYTAVFDAASGKQIVNDCAVPVSTLYELIKGRQNINLIGDGALMVSCFLNENGINANILDVDSSTSPAVGAALLTINAKTLDNAFDINPIYLRLPQAERERNEKLANSNMQ